MKRLLLVIASFVLAFNANASHFSGGEIRYEFNGTNYDVFLTMYKVCEASAGAPLPNTSVSVDVKSVSLNSSFTTTLSFLGFDTVNINCPNTANLCHTPATGTLPGYIQARFQGTVALPAQANDWHISWSQCCRISGIVNGSSNQNFYVETWLDNTAAINSNAKMTTAPTYYISVNDTAEIPLQTIDPEGDSIAYNIVEPMSAAGIVIPYGPAPYSVTNPLGTGGICKIDAATHILTLKATSQGMYDVAFNVEEYRNGVKVGSYIRDITIAVVPSSPKLSFPKQNVNNAQFVYTCPGQTNNTVVLNFTDPIGTDSVYVDVEFPNLTGWNFNATTTNGIPNATTTINFTTPGTLDPATLPHFYIKVKARDNACPGSTAEYSLLVRTRQCIADSVWPGDANGDFTVNIYDPLAIAIAAGKTGPTRPGANTTWTAQACPNWANVFVTNNTNIKHADCNGDGTVNNTDLGAVTANYSLSHQKGGRNKGTGNYDLYFDMTGLRIAPGKPISIPIKLGTATQTVNDVYGIGTRILIDGLPLTTAPTVSNANSWIDNSSSAINFSHGVTATSVDWALGRTNQQNTSGQGVIGTLDFIVPANAVVGSNVTLSFENTVIINKDGMERYDANELDETTMILYPESVENATPGIQSVSIVPNPSGSTAQLNVVLNEGTGLTVTVADVTGKVIWTATGKYGQGTQQIALPAAQLSAGMYMVQLETDGGNTSVMKWVKQ